ncbi:hypothetical protein [Paraburkholderia sp.]|uniref:hypothetical protein n=1 Tax=Paraburkholderia sp. TaxID=1926495 RepID=UPI0025F25E23|nr:hypothetical protein [Paraburkholderia sp.]
MTMLLYKTAVAPLTETERQGWYAIAGTGGVTEFEDAGHLINDLTVGADAWTHLEGAQVVGLHDDSEVTEDDPRFNHEADDDGFAVVRSPLGGLYLAMSINVPEALLMQKADLIPGGKDFAFGEVLEKAWADFIKSSR